MKTENECWLTELKYCREDLVVQDLSPPQSLLKYLQITYMKFPE